MADPGGLTATATATLTVRPVNDAPEAVGTIPEQELEEGGDTLTLDLTPYFTDIDGDVLAYTAESSDPAAAVLVTGATLTLTAVVAGSATITVTASDPAGLTAIQTFGVGVGDGRVREVLTDTLAALGRGYLSSVRQTVGRRLETGGRGTQRLMVAGRQLGPGAWNRLGPGGLMQTHAWLTRAAALRQRHAAIGLTGTPAAPRLQPMAVNDAFNGFGLSRVGLDQVLQGTDVLFTFGGVGQRPEAAPGRQHRWTIWGQGDLQAFRGAPDAVRDYEGDLRTGYLGVDALAGRSWLFGVAVGRSGGRGTWQRGVAAGRLKTTLTTVHPYLRWGSGDTTLWAVAGAGRGTATLTRTMAERQDESPLGLTLGLLEARRRLATVGRGLRIGLRGEASAAGLATGEGDETIDRLRAGVQRLRGGIELTQDLDGPGGSTLTPFGEVSARRDAGAGPTGVGLEVAGGLRLRGGRFQVEAQGRRLVLHSATGYSDHGLSLAASVGAGAYQPGLILMVRPTWGAAGMGADTLWQDHFQLAGQGAGDDEGGLDARVGYGLRLPNGGLLEPFGGYGQREGLGRRLQLGARLGALDRIPGVFGGPVQLELTGERYDRPGSSSDHRFSLVGVIDFAARRAMSLPPVSVGRNVRRGTPIEAAAPAVARREAARAPDRTLGGDVERDSVVASAVDIDLLEVPHVPAASNWPVTATVGRVELPLPESETLAVTAARRGPPTAPATTRPRRPEAPSWPAAPVRGDHEPSQARQVPSGSPALSGNERPLPTS